MVYDGGRSVVEARNTVTVLVPVQLWPSTLVMGVLYG